MARIAASEARENFATILNEVAFGGERVLLHRHGKDVAAVVPIEDVQLLEALEDKMDLEHDLSVIFTLVERPGGAHQG